MTYTTSKPRSAILATMSALGIELRPEQLITAPIIGRDYLRREGITRCFPLLKASLLEDLATIEFVESSPQAVLVGNIGDALTYAALNRRFVFFSTAPPSLRWPGTAISVERMVSVWTCRLRRSI